MTAYTQLCEKMRAEPSTWLVTGVAGFIGSNLLEHLLKMGQTVVGLDNFLTGYQKNLDMVEALVGPEAWSRFTFIEGDIRDLDTCRKACEGVDHVLHEAALGSVPRSIDDPILSNSCNITGYLNMLVAARDAGVHVELSTAALRKNLGDYYPAEGLLRRFCQAGVPITVGSDSHEASTVGFGIAEAYEYAARVGYTSIDVPTADGDWRTIALD